MAPSFPLSREVEGARSRPGWLDTMRGVSMKHFLGVLVVTMMATMDGISMISAYLLDIFSTTSNSPLAIVLVPQSYHNSHTLLPSD